MPETGVNKSFWMICTTHMFLEVYYLTQATLIPAYVAEFNLSLLEASAIVTVQSLVGLIMNVPAGLLADRFSAKHLLFASMMIEGASALFLSQTGSFWTLALGAAVMRVASPIYHISGLSQISKNVKSTQISKSMGFHNAFGSLGSALGAVSLSVFLSTIGWRWIYLFWSIPILTWGLILMRSPQLATTRIEGREIKRVKGLTKLALVFTTDFLIFLVAIGVREVGITGIMTFMTTYLVNVRGLSKSTASLIFGLGPVTGILGSLNGGYLGEKVGAKKALSIAILGCTISIIILAASSQVYLLTAIFILYSFFNNSVWTPMNTIVADIAPVTERGVGYSAYFFTEGLTQSITPTIAATVIQAYDIGYIFPFGMIFVATSLILLQPLHQPRKQIAEQK